jgi:hypothetical protein
MCNHCSFLIAPLCKASRFPCTFCSDSPEQSAAGTDAIADESFAVTLNVGQLEEISPTGSTKYNCRWSQHVSSAGRVAHVMHSLTVANHLLS